MRHRSLFACLALCAATAQAADEKPNNPYKSAKVGDWFAFTVSLTSTTGRETVSTHTYTVTKKTPGMVNLKYVEKNVEREMPPGNVEIELNIPYEWGKMGGSQYRKTGEADEKISAGGKTYACHRTDYKVSSDNPGAEETTLKVWECKDVPMDHVVKWELKVGKSVTLRELIAFGADGK